MKSRTFFFVLLVVNVVLGGLLAWSLLTPDTPAAPPVEEHADRVRLENEGAASAPVAASAPPSVPVEHEASAPQASPVQPGQAEAEPEVQASVPEAVPAQKLVCLRWGDFTATQWREARGAVRQQLGQVEIEETLNDDKARFWVYLPPFESQEAAREAVADLKSRGVTDTFIIQEPGPQQLAVSLGLFSKKAMAEEFVARLKARGIDRIVSKPHPQSRYISILLRNVPESQKAAVRTLAAGFEKTTLQPVRCAP